MRLAAVLGLACLFTAAPSVATAQEVLHSKAKKQSTTFSGHIVDLKPDRVTVSRSILGSKAEKRTFLITPDTKIEGKLKVKAKVTIGFTTNDDGDVVARLIRVRQPRK